MHEQDADDYVNAIFTNTKYQKILDLLNKEPSHANTTIANSSELSGITCLSLLNSNDWIVDSGASDHMCFSLDRFCFYKSINKLGHQITIPDGRKISVKYMGTVKLQNGVFLQNVLYVPQFRFNLISVNKLISDLKCKLTFETDGCYVQGSLMKKPWLLGKHKSGLYIFKENECKESVTIASQQKISPEAPQKACNAQSSSSPNSLLNKAKFWHLKLGHLPFNKLQIIFPDISGKFVKSNIMCTVCPLGRQTRTNYPKSCCKTSKPLELLHIDI